MRDDVNHPWKLFLDQRLKSVGGKYLFKCNFDLKSLQLKLPLFYQEALEAWSYSNIPLDITELDIANQSIWNNRYIILGGKSIFNSTLKHKGFEFIDDLYNEDRYLTWNDLLATNLHISEVLLLYGAIKSLSQKWNEIEHPGVSGALEEDQYYFNCKFKSLEKITKTVAKRVIQSKDDFRPISEKYFERELKFARPWDLAYRIPFTVAIDTKTHEFQFKLLHHIFYFSTNYELFRRG